MFGCVHPDPKATQSGKVGVVAAIFANGAVTGAFVQALNHELHRDGVYKDDEGYGVYESEEWDSIGFLEKPLGDWEVLGELPFAKEIRIPGTSSRFEIGLDIQFIRRRYGQFERFQMVHRERYRYSGERTGREWRTPIVKDQFRVFTRTSYDVRPCDNGACLGPAFGWSG